MPLPHELLKVPATATLNEVRAAYRALARRWHPDRFLPGPEREWANVKMAELNGAYRACLDRAKRRSPEAENLTRVRELIEDGNYSTARELLMRASTRSAEWNYLFGALLLRTFETQKALIYLSVACHQQPKSEKYRKAVEYAERRIKAKK